MYFHNSELQRQWAWELLAKQHFNGQERILDFGCGDGKICAELSRFVPRGGITGFDISSEMIAFAKIKFPQYAYPNLEFKQSSSLTFEDVPGKQTYDVVTSFCVFHLVPNSLEILKNLKSHLKPEGKLVLVVPAGKNPAFFEAANQTFEKYQMSAPWKNTPPANPSMRTTDGCRTLLTNAGYRVQSIEMVDTDTAFYDKQELIDYTIGTTTANWNIPVAKSRSFFTDLVNRMIELDSEVIDSEGRVHFKLSRIHVVALPEN